MNTTTIETSEKCRQGNNDSDTKRQLQRTSIGRRRFRVAILNRNYVIYAMHTKISVKGLLIVES